MSFAREVERERGRGACVPLDQLDRWEPHLARALIIRTKGASENKSRLVGGDKEADFEAVRRREKENNVESGRNSCKLKCDNDRICVHELGSSSSCRFWFVY